MYLKIFKYKIPGPGQFTVAMPRGAKVLAIGIQRSGFFQDPVFWAQFEAENQHCLEHRSFAVVPTGVEFEATGLRYIGTFQQTTFVWHVYEGAL
jgi:hypothetical protein